MKKVDGSVRVWGILGEDTPHRGVIGDFEIRSQETDYSFSVISGLN
jgi:hypothetical protein